MTKNKIKPHKGGRTTRLDIRLSEDEKQEISDKAKQCGINKTDLIVAAGALIESVGYFTFFYVLGGIVMVVGLLAGGFLPDQPSDHLPQSEKSLWQEIRELFRLETLREHSKLFIILISSDRKSVV